MRTAILVGVGLGATAAAFFLWPRAVQDGNAPMAVDTGAAMMTVTVPELSAEEQMGARAFDAKCASCHGKDAAGQAGKAPPLVHKIYEPGHHGDAAFLLAAQNGARAHHWPFGDMPAVEGITPAEIAGIVGYVRALQRANGIF